MKYSPRTLGSCLTLCLFAMQAFAAAQTSSTPAVEAANSPAVESTADTAPPVEVERDSSENADWPQRHRWRNRGNELVVIGENAHLAEGEYADAVVAVLGSATAAGEVFGAVVSILGNTRVTGRVGDSAVAVLGSVYVDGKVEHQVVAVMGNVNLGPNAEVHGDVVSVGGRVNRDPGALIGGNIKNVSFFGGIGDFSWFRSWIKNCLFYGRPLALEADLSWAWTLAFGFLAVYVLFALMFRDGVEKCVHTFETRPGRSALTALLSILAMPVLTVLLCITVIGIAIVPFLWIAIFCATLFGKAVMLAWLGGRITQSMGSAALRHPAVGVLLGGFIVLGLYVVPVVGSIVFNLLGILGLGVVAYTVLLANIARRQSQPVGATFSSASNPPHAETSFTAASAASHQAEPASPPPPEPPPAATPNPAVAVTTLPRAGFWLRMGALLIDLLLVGALVNVLDFNHGDHGNVLILLALYGALMWKFRGTTVGGIVCHLKVVRVDHREMDWSTSIVRALSCFLSLVACGLGFFWIAFDPERQAWHDKIAGTWVVRVPKGVSLV